MLFGSEKWIGWVPGAKNEGLRFRAILNGIDSELGGRRVIITSRTIHKGLQGGSRVEVPPCPTCPVLLDGALTEVSYENPPCLSLR